MINKSDSVDMKQAFEFLEKAYQVFDDLANKPGSDKKRNNGFS